MYIYELIVTFFYYYFNLHLFCFFNIIAKNLKFLLSKFHDKNRLVSFFNGRFFKNAIRFDTIRGETKEVRAKLVL